ncbi:MAG: hypothetical protein QF430_01340 [Candidatus Marinimicrobia bacterium]|jgi:CheY-like chemotaxis protein|nr:hypothetical protein [Candidatus Neomarinimicrobiota bacterium]MDP7071508.1 hypothetical protein [Candidatus Neomarinimicrobiota bacterium]|tara:strand:+ start:81 stop:422 length:342 start_codon:yes stop_codon:yes gene_type:complete
MKIHIISNDDFFSQELMMSIGRDVSIEISTNGLLALNEIKKEPTDVIVLDNESDGLNPLVLTKLVKRDRSLQNIKIFFVVAEDNFTDDAHYQFDGIYTKNKIISELFNSVNTA